MSIWGARPPGPQPSGRGAWGGGAVAASDTRPPGLAPTLGPTRMGSCGSGAGEQRTGGAGGGNVGWSGNGPRRIPISGGSSLVAHGGALRPPGYVGYRQPYAIKGLGAREIAQRKRPPQSFQAVRRLEPLIPEGREPLGNPDNPTTTRPLHLIVDAAQRWLGRNPSSMSVADWRPIEGQPRMLAQGVPGGVALPRITSLAGASAYLPMDRLARKRLTEFELSMRQAHFTTKRGTFITAGPSPGQYAQAPRINPTTPNKILGTGPQEWGRPTTLRGTKAEVYFAPRSTIDRMNALARIYGQR